jgi:hypothetical protein
MTADELKAAFAELPPMEPVESAHNWEFWRWDLRQKVASNDPTDFLNWPTVVGTMFVGNAPYIDYEANNIAEDHDMGDLEETKIGHPAIYSYFGLKTSGNMIHQAYHLSQWEKKTLWRLDDLDTIIEIGGGYGTMALIVHRLGFRGRYIIYDLSEFSLLQQYYLSNVGVDNVEFRTTIEKPIEADLLIGLYSLNEMSLSSRQVIIDLCPAQSYLIAYGASWGGIDNMVWAATLMKRNGYNWHNWNIEHLPNCWYLTGDKRK